MVSRGAVVLQGAEQCFQVGAGEGWEGSTVEDEDRCSRKLQAGAQLAVGEDLADQLLREKMEKLTAGSVITVTVWRWGKRKELSQRWYPGE